MLYTSENGVFQAPTDTGTGSREIEVNCVPKKERSDIDVFAGRPIKVAHIGGPDIPTVSCVPPNPASIFI